MLCAVLAADDPQHAQHPGNPKRGGRPVQPAERSHGIGAGDHHTDDYQAGKRVLPGLITQFPAQGPGMKEQPERVGSLIAVRKIAKLGSPLLWLWLT
jgi:hypothetical protein